MILSLFLSLPLSPAVVFSSSEKHGATSSTRTHLTSPLLQGSPAEGDRLKPDAEDAERMEAALGPEVESSEESLPSLPSISDSVKSAQYIATRPNGKRAFRSPPDWALCKGVLISACWGSVLGSILGISIASLPRLEMDAERCAADVIGRLVDEGCLERSYLRIISDPIAYPAVQPQQTEGCYRGGEESLRCCSEVASAAISEMLDWSGVSNEVKDRVKDEVCSENVDLKGWCYGEKKYALYWEE